MLTAALILYIKYLFVGMALMGVFMWVYERITPYSELTLIREGNMAAALSFGGALLGFSLALASSALHSLSIPQFSGWAALAGAIQLVVFAIACLCIRQVKDHIENGNVAVGLAMFFLSVAVGLLNAAALS